MADAWQVSPFFPHLQESTGWRTALINTRMTEFKNLVTTAQTMGILLKQIRGYFNSN